MEPTTLLLVASFLAPVPVTRQSAFFAQPSSEFSVLSTVQESTQTVKKLPTSLASDFLAIDTPSSLKSLVEEEIATYAQLADDWDSEGGSAPSVETVISASLIAKYVPIESNVKTMVSSSGAISLYWDESGGYAELGVDQDQSCYFFARNRSGKEKFIEGLSVADVASREWISKNLKDIKEFAT